MLLQLHHQFKDGHTDFIAQNDIETYEQMGAWQKEVADEYPLPPNAQWFVCMEGSEDFVMANAEAKPAGETEQANE